MSMTTSSAGGAASPRRQRSIWPLVMAVIAAAAIGAMVAGPELAVAAAGGALVVSLLPRLILVAGRGGFGAIGLAAQALRMAGRLGGVLIALPGLFITSLIWLAVGLPMALVARAHARAATSGVAPAALPRLPDLGAVAAMAGRVRTGIRHVLADMVSPRGLPLLLTNILLLLAIGCVTLGMGVALYAALLAVPAMIATMMLVALDGSAEPEVPGDDAAGHH